MKVKYDQHGSIFPRCGTQNEIYAITGRRTAPSSTIDRGWNGEVELVTTILDHGAKPDVLHLARHESKEARRVLDNEKTELSLAAEKGHVDIMRMLISAGANPQTSRDWSRRLNDLTGDRPI